MLLAGIVENLAAGLKYAVGSEDVALTEYAVASAVV